MIANRPLAQRSNWLVMVGYIALTALMTYPLITEFGRAIPGDGFDGWQNYWNLWWVRKALLEMGVSPYYTPLLYYPTGVSLAFQTMNLFNGLISLPISLLFGLLPAYNSIAAFSFIAGAFGAYLLARYALLRAGYGGRSAMWPAILAGVIYAFSPFHFAHLLGHMQVFSLEWLPFAVLALLRGMDQLQEGPLSIRRMLNAVAPASLFLILAGLCDWYFAYYLALFTVLLAAYRLCARALVGRQIFFLILAWLGFLVILAPAWLPMVREARQANYMIPDEQQARALSADLLAFFTPNEFHPVWGDAAGQLAQRFSSTLSERTVFAGFAPLALGLWAGIALGKRSRFWWTAALVFALFALGPVLHIAGQSSIPLPYALIYRYLPFARIARSIARFDVMVMLALSVLAALGLAALSRRIPYVKSSWLGAPAIAIVCFEFLSIPYPFSPPDTPAYYGELARQPGDFAVLNLPMNWDRPGYLLYQTTHGRPLIAGYISREDPRTLVYRTPILQELRFLGLDILCDDVARIGPSVLDWLHVRYVILDRYKMPGGAEREITTALAEQIFAGVAPSYADERITVYQLAPLEQRLPFPILEDGWGPRQEEAGRVWREVRGVANLSIQAVAGQPRRILIRASGDPSSALLALAEKEHLGRLRLSQQESDMIIKWTPAQTPALLTLRVEGPAPARVSLIRID